MCPNELENMGACHSCFSPAADFIIEHQNHPNQQNAPVPAGSNNDNEPNVPAEQNVPAPGGPNNNVEVFAFGELVMATDHFKLDNLLGEGGFGKVYKGHLTRLNLDVAVKQLDLQSSTQGCDEFIQEVMSLGHADHPNLVKLIGYCIEGNQNIIVYEYHLHDLQPDSEPLDWNTRMKIAAGAVQGLEYIHTTMNPKLIHGDLKSANILLGENYHAKLSDFGLAKVAPRGDRTHVSTRVMGTLGYCAPEYYMTGHLTTRSDIFSFGVVLLEIITGRQALDNTKPPNERNLVNWAKGQLKNRKNFLGMADPLLNGQFTKSNFFSALGIAGICTHSDPKLRPEIDELVPALVFLASKPYPPPDSSNSSTSQITVAARR